MTNILHSDCDFLCETAQSRVQRVTRMKLTVLVLIGGLAALAANSGMELYQKAVTQERAGKMEEAIKLYQQVAHDFASDRALAAKALVQAARGYEKLGQDGAVKLYERVAREYGDQRESAQAAQAKLAALRQAATPTMTLRKIEFGENVKNVVATDGQQAVYWDEARTTLLFGDVAGKNKRVVLQTKPQQIPTVIVSPDFSMALLYFPGVPKPSHWAVIKTDGTGYRELPNLPADTARATWSWDNRFVLIGRTLKKVSIADGQIRELLPRGGAGVAKFSPDGRFIAFDGPVDPVQVIPAQGGEPKVIAGTAILGDWTRDGRFLMVAAGAGSDAELYAVPIQNGQPAGERVRIPAALPEDVTESWTTAGGVQILKTGATAGLVPPTFLPYWLSRNVIASLNNENHLGPWEPLDLIDGDSSLPAWSPDGRQIAYRAGGARTLPRAVRIRTLADGADRELFRERSRNFVINCIWAVQRPNLYCGSADLEAQKTAVLSVPLNSGAAERIGSFDGGRILIRVSPDDRTLYMGAPGGLPGGGIGYAWEIGTANEKELPRGIVSPGGRWVYGVDSFSAGRREIRIRPASDPEGWRHVADLSYPAPDPSEVVPTPVKVSPDDNWVVYQNLDTDGKFALYRVSTSGGEPERLGDYPTSDAGTFLVVSPDSRQFIVQFRVPHRPAEFWALENFLPKPKPAR
jgi:Tol biopolymer transport system component